MEYIKVHLLRCQPLLEQAQETAQLEINQPENETNEREATRNERNEKITTDTNSTLENNFPTPETAQLEINQRGNETNERETKTNESNEKITTDTNSTLDNNSDSADLDTQSSVSTCGRRHRHHHRRRHHKHAVLGGKANQAGDEMPVDTLATSDSENDRRLQSLLDQMPELVRGLPELQEALLRYQELRAGLQELESRVHHGEQITPLRLTELEGHEVAGVSNKPYFMHGGCRSRVVFAWPETNQPKQRSLGKRFTCALFRLVAFVLHALALTHLLPDTEYEHSWGFPLKVTLPPTSKKQERCTVIEPEWEQQ